MSLMINRVRGGIIPPQDNTLEQPRICEMESDSTWIDLVWYLVIGRGGTIKICQFLGPSRSPGGDERIPVLIIGLQMSLDSFLWSVFFASLVYSLVYSNKCIKVEYLVKKVFQIQIDPPSASKVQPLLRSLTAKPSAASPPRNMMASSQGAFVSSVELCARSCEGTWDYSS